MIPAEETGRLAVRRRRRNRPGNAQAKGPRGSWHSGKRRRLKASSTAGRTLTRKRLENLSGLGTEGAQSNGPQASMEPAPLRKPMADPAHSDEPLLKTPLHAEHV